jgi:Bacterial toxin 50
MMLSGRSTLSRPRLGSVRRALRAEPRRRLGQSAERCCGRCCRRAACCPTTPLQALRTPMRAPGRQRAQSRMSATKRRPREMVSQFRCTKGQQGKHIAGATNFDPTRSTLTQDPNTLLGRFSRRGRQVGETPVGLPGSKEVFDTGDQVIGVYRTQAGRSAPTTRGIIHYSSKGAHIVPAAPRNWQP